MAPTELLTITPTVSFTLFNSKRRIHSYRRCMEGVSTSQCPAQKWSLGDLSTELLSLIFKNLRDLDAKSLAAARLLSRRINAIVTPIKFEYLRLNDNIISSRAETNLPQGLQHVYSHTRHVEARSDLDPERIKYILDKIQRLLSIRWRYVRTDSLRAGHFWMPSDILPARRHAPSQSQSETEIKLYIEDLPLRDFDNGEPHDTYLQAIPTRNLVSLKMASPTPPLVARLEPLKRLLVASPRLETFHYRDRGQGGKFAFAPGERLPAFRDLSLRSYDWDHPADTVRRHWDFSQLRHLTLVDVPLHPFLSSVLDLDLDTDPELDPATDRPSPPLLLLLLLARRLETLHCEDASAHVAPGRRAAATRALRLLVQSGTRLRALSLMCDVQVFGAASALLPAHAEALDTLRLRDHAGFGDEARPCPTLRAGDVALLSRRLGRLRELELDLDVAACDDAGAFLAALCAFPRLETLVLHTQTVVRPLLEDEGELDDAGGDGGGVVDRDYEAAVRTFSFLVRGKLDCSAAAAPWRSITINVGGWRRHMVRRTSEAWRERNLRGVYAERCFVLERGEDGAGEMTMREEMALDM